MSKRRPVSPARSCQDTLPRDVRTLGEDEEIEERGQKIQLYLSLCVIFEFDQREGDPPALPFVSRHDPFPKLGEGRGCGEEQKDADGYLMKTKHDERDLFGPTHQ